MVRFLVDINLPYRFSFWHGEEFLHQRNLDEAWPDTSIWDYAATWKLVIITKDKDFAQRMRVSEPPPRVIWVRSGNCSLRELYLFLEPYWKQALVSIVASKLVTISNDGLVSS